MTTVVIVVCCVGSQPALGASLTGVLGFAEVLNSRRVGLQELFDDVTIGIIELTTEISTN